MYVYRPQSEAGFSLIEVLIAFAIAAIVIATLLRVEGDALNNALLLEEYTAALGIAESVINQVSSENRLEPQQIEGRQAEKYQWQLKIAALSSQDLSEHEMFKTVEQQTLQLMALDISVTWLHGGSHKQIHLTTVRAVLG